MGFTSYIGRLCDLCGFQDPVEATHSKFEGGWTTITIHNDAVHETYLMCPNCAKKIDNVIEDIKGKVEM